MSENIRVKTDETHVIVRRYVHGQEESLSSLWPVDHPAQEKYDYSLYEVAVDLEVDLVTGESAIVAVDGRLLSDEKVPW